MIRTATLLGLLGLLVATGLFIWQGLGPVLHAYTAVGFGLFWISAAHFISMSFNARAWQILVPTFRRPSTAFFLWAVWLREAVNGLLPVARVGGEVAGTRLLISRGLSPSLSIASLIADVTICLGTQLFCTLFGIGVLIYDMNDRSPIGGIVAGAVLSFVIISLLIFTQRYGFFSLMMSATRRLFGDRFNAMVTTAANLDLKVKRLYCRRKALVFCGVWQVLGYAATSGEIWLSLYFLGHPISLLNAAMIEGLIQALSSSAFLVPGALGVQEGGFIVLGSFIGLSSETSLALALIRRTRDITVFVPALLIWQLDLGKRFFARTLNA